MGSLIRKRGGLKAFLMGKTKPVEDTGQTSDAAFAAAMAKASNAGQPAAAEAAAPTQAGPDVQSVDISTVGDDTSVVDDGTQRRIKPRDTYSSINI